MTRMTSRAVVLRLARRPQGVASRDLSARGIHRQTLTRLLSSGELERVVRGHYRLPISEVTEHHGLALVSCAVPQGVICLHSALQFHGIGTQMPHQVWVALDRRARKPALAYPPLRLVRFSGDALVFGIEHHRVEGVDVPVYGVAKTLADCFKYRNKIGLDVAMEALRDAWRLRRFKMDDLLRAAQVCRVQQVMRPYLDLLVA